ncbi:thiol-disulfide oxidoreductase DCC family protein [Lacinutrix undariae]
MTVKLPKHKQLILFDGVCNLCNHAIQYVIKHDKNDVFMFAALESDTGQQIIKHYNIDVNKIDSILLYSEVFGLKYKSSAAIKIGSQLGFPQYLIGVFYIVPTFIRNFAYDFIAKNRYRWFGKKASCMIPSVALKSKFLQ